MKHNASVARDAAQSRVRVGHNCARSHALEKVMCCEGEPSLGGEGEPKDAAQSRVRVEHNWARKPRAGIGHVL